ncbi:MAG: DUF6650 family protein [Solirubrobacteraceae bacterium]
MKFSEILSRLDGISTPIGGVSWTPPESDVAVARRVLVFLEDRRVLYEPYEAEVPNHCVQSVLEIRRFLTDQLAGGGIGEDLSGPLRAIRAACRKFLGDADDRRRGWGFDDAWHGPGPGWEFNQTLGEMRGVIGLHVAQIAARYRLDVPDPLAKILPARDE